MRLAILMLALALGVPVGTPEIAVESYGLVELVAAGGAYHTLHVRATLGNPGGIAVSLDVSKARLGRHRPLFVNADVATLPVVRVGPGDQRVVDFYFLPSDEPFTWSRLRAPPLVAPRGPLGAARYWWSDPAHPWPQQRHQDGVITPRPPVDATVR